jgi:hypothetical protein
MLSGRELRAWIREEGKRVVRGEVEELSRRVVSELWRKVMWVGRRVESRRKWSRRVEVLGQLCGREGCVVFEGVTYELLSCGEGRLFELVRLMLVELRRNVRERSKVEVIVVDVIDEELEELRERLCKLREIEYVREGVVMGERKEYVGVNKYGNWLGRVRGWSRMSWKERRQDVVNVEREKKLMVSGDADVVRKAVVVHCRDMLRVRGVKRSSERMLEKVREVGKRVGEVCRRKLGAVEEFGKRLVDRERELGDWVVEKARLEGVVEKREAARRLIEKEVREKVVGGGRSVVMVNREIELRCSGLGMSVVRAELEYAKEMCMLKMMEVEVAEFGRESMVVGTERDKVEFGYGGSCIEVGRSDGGVGVGRLLESRKKLVGKKWKYVVENSKVREEFVDSSGLRGKIVGVEKECGGSRILAVHGLENSMFVGVQKRMFRSVEELFCKLVMEGKKREDVERVVMELFEMGREDEVMAWLDQTSATDRLNGDVVRAAVEGIMEGLGECDEMVGEYVVRNGQSHRMLWVMERDDIEVLLVEMCSKSVGFDVELESELMSRLYGGGVDGVGEKYRLVVEGKYERGFKSVVCKGWGGSDELWKVRLEGEERVKWGLVGWSKGGTCMGAGLSWVVLNVVSRGVGEVLFGKGVVMCQCGDDVGGEGSIEKWRGGFREVGGEVNSKSVGGKVEVEFCGEKGRRVGGGKVEWDCGLRLGGVVKSSRKMEWKSGSENSASDGCWVEKGAGSLFVSGVKSGLESLVKEYVGVSKKVMREKLDWYLLECERRSGGMYSRLRGMFMGWWLLCMDGLVKFSRAESRAVCKEKRLWLKVALGHVESSEYVGRRLGLVEEAGKVGGDVEFKSLERWIGRGLMYSMRKLVRKSQLSGRLEKYEGEEVGDECVKVMEYVRGRFSSLSDSKWEEFWSRYGGWNVGGRWVLSDVILEVLEGMVVGKEGVCTESREGAMNELRKVGFVDSEGCHDVMWVVRKLLRESYMFSGGWECVERLYGKVGRGGVEKRKLRGVCKENGRLRKEVGRTWGLYCKRYGVGDLYERLRRGVCNVGSMGRLMCKVESERVCFEEKGMLVSMVDGLVVKSQVGRYVGSGGLGGLCARRFQLVNGIDSFSSFCANESLPIEGYPFKRQTS